MEGPLEGPMDGLLEGPMKGPLEGPMEGAVGGPYWRALWRALLEGPMEGPNGGPYWRALWSALWRALLEGPMERDPQKNQKRWPLGGSSWHLHWWPRGHLVIHAQQKRPLLYAVLLVGTSHEILACKCLRYPLSRVQTSLMFGILWIF